MKSHVKCRGAACVLIVLGVLATMAHGLDLQAKIDPLARPLIENDIVVGFVVGIVKDGQTQVLAYGETTKGSGVAPNANTVYEIGSISKVFTAVLLADMVQKGIVKLEDPVQKYLPAKVRMPVDGGKPITLEHLATHTSGLPKMPNNLTPTDSSNIFANYTELQMYEFLMEHELRRVPGEYEYSSYGMGLLGHMLARRMGKTYEQCLVKQICGPLKMRDTRVKLNRGQRRRLATPYNSALKLETPWDFSTFVGTGGIRSTCNDMVKFIKANLRYDDKPLTQALRLSRKKRHAMKNGQGMGLGWHIARDGITRLKGGKTGGYKCWLAVVPSRKFGVIVLGNTSSLRIDQLGNNITRIAAFGRNVEPPKPRKAIHVDPAVLKTYVGVYRLRPQFDMTVTVEDGKLMVQATGQSKHEVFAESKTKFFYKVVDAQISFFPDQDGKINHLILHQRGRNHGGVRQE